jgi:hypothetical protein
VNVRDRATRLLVLTEECLAKVLAAKNEYLAEIDVLKREYREDTGEPAPALPRPPRWNLHLRLRQCADELQAALDEGAPDPMVAARLDALLDASKELWQ